MVVQDTRFQLLLFLSFLFTSWLIAKELRCNPLNQMKRFCSPIAVQVLLINTNIVLASYSLIALIAYLSGDSLPSYSYYLEWRLIAWLVGSTLTGTIFLLLVTGTYALVISNKGGPSFTQGLVIILCAYIFSATVKNGSLLFNQYFSRSGVLSQASFLTPKKPAKPSVIGTVKYKPVIYLYPEAIQHITVRLLYKGELTVTYPQIEKDLQGWDVIAHPESRIVTKDGREYSYLFWEGHPDRPVPFDLSKGFIVRGRDTAEFLRTTLAKMGLTPREYNEFIVFWLPRMQDNEWNQIYFAADEYEDVAPLIVNPKPDSTMRVFMAFRKIFKPIKVTPQKIMSSTRKGFTLVEWGGSELPPLDVLQARETPQN